MTVGKTIATVCAAAVLSLAMTSLCWGIAINDRVQVLSSGSPLNMRVAPSATASCYNTNVTSCPSSAQKTTGASGTVSATASGTGTVSQWLQINWDSGPSSVWSAAGNTSGVAYVSLIAAPLVAPVASSPIGNVTITGLTPTFAWSGGSGAANYEINVREVNAATVLFRQQGISTSSTSFAMPSGYLQANKNYKWDISACPNFTCSSGYSTSADAFFNTLSAPTTGTPTCTNVPTSLATDMTYIKNYAVDGRFMLLGIECTATPPTGSRSNSKRLK